RPGLRRCDSVVAPKTAKTAWHRDTCFDSPTSRERLAKMATKITVVVAVSRRDPDRTAGSTAATVIPAPSDRQAGAGRAAVDRPTRPSPWISAKKPRGLATRTPNRTMNGRLEGSPTSVGLVAAYFVATAAAMAMP